MREVLSKKSMAMKKANLETTLPAADPSEVMNISRYTFQACHVCSTYLLKGNV